MDKTAGEVVFNVKTAGEVVFNVVVYRSINRIQTFEDWRREEGERFTEACSFCRHRAVLGHARTVFTHSTPCIDLKRLPPQPTYWLTLLLPFGFLG